MAEAQYSGQAKFQTYGENVDAHIDIGTGFASNVISHPGGFSYSSSQTPFDVLDQRMVDMQSDAKEMIRDMLLRDRVINGTLFSIKRLTLVIYLIIKI